MPVTKYYTEEERRTAQYASHKRWRERNKKAVSSKQREFRRANLERYAEYQRAWRAANPARYKEIDSKSYERTRQHNRQSRLLSAAKDRARNLGLPFDLDHEDIVIPTHCPVLGIELKRGNNTTRPELDRIEPEKGYVKGNVCVISGRANRIKWNATLEELMAVVEYVQGSKSRHPR